MSPIRVGLVGYGHTTRTFHLPYILLNPGLHLEAFVQRHDKPTVRGKPGTHCKDDYPDTKWYRTVEELLADKEVDLVCVLTGHDSHADISEAALLAGKHVVVEKCFTTSTEEADRVLAAQKKSGKVLTVFQNRRYDSDFLTLKKVLGEKALGRITECEIHYDQDRPPTESTPITAGGGMLFGIGSHTIDQALVLFGRPTSVTGFYRALLGVGSKGQTDNAFTVILQYGNESDLIVTVKSSNVSRLRHQLKYYVRGTDGTFLKYGQDIQEPQITKGMKPTDKNYGIEPEETWGTLETTKKNPLSSDQKEQDGLWIGQVPSVKGNYGQFYQDVVDSIRGAPQQVDPKDGRDGIRIIELARQSADEGRTLPFA